MTLVHQQHEYRFKKPVNPRQASAWPVSTRLGRYRYCLGLIRFEYRSRTCGVAGGGFVCGVQRHGPLLRIHLRIRSCTIRVEPSPPPPVTKCPGSAVVAGDTCSFDGRLFSDYCFFFFFLVCSIITAPSIKTRCVNHPWLLRNSIYCTSFDSNILCLLHFCFFFWRIRMPSMHYL